MAVMLSGMAAVVCVNMVSDISKWLLECEPYARPHTSHSCATRTESRMVQKCGSTNGMSIAYSYMVWPI